MQHPEKSLRRRKLEWPPEAAQIIASSTNPIQKCDALVNASKNDRQACWRYLKRHGVDRPMEQKRRRYQWPEQASVIAKRGGNAVSRCAELMRLTGYSDRTCWAFLKRHGIERPGAKRRITFTPSAFDRLFDCVMNHGYKEASIRFKVDAKTIYNAFYRRGWTSRARDGYTLLDLQRFLRVRPSTILGWVETGLLTAKRSVRADGKTVHKFDHEEVVRFCRENIRTLLPRRWPAKRLEFIELLACAPKHADQLATREAKRERQAYEDHMSRFEDDEEA